MTFVNRPSQQDADELSEEYVNAFVDAITTRPYVPSRTPPPTGIPTEQKSFEAWRFVQRLHGRGCLPWVEAATPEQAIRAYDDWVSSITSISEVWDAAKHPRGGYPQNRGWFSAAGSNSGLTRGTTASKVNATQIRKGRPESRVSWIKGSPTASTDSRTRQSPRVSPIHYVSDENGGAEEERSDAKNDGMGAAGTTAVAAGGGIRETKVQLPADHRGSWIRGKKGHGTFRFFDTPENRKAGVAGKSFRYVDGHIAVGGFPPEAYYGGKASAATISVPKVSGSDKAAAEAAMRQKLGNAAWKTPPGYVWNHAGPPGSRVMELVREEYHTALAHKGPAAIPRATTRGLTNSNRTRRPGGGSTSARALGVATVYLAARDVLKMAGALGPEYHSDEGLTYKFRDETDGSEFVIKPGWIRSSRREFISGPRAGQSEPISKEEVENYRAAAEKEFGKFVPGKNPR
ncbi:MAG TPA: HNH endonuclease, partial [Gemmataceae bacterium]|nr:HNH endonuclease [Gemmataceae bacterium]